MGNTRVAFSDLDENRLIAIRDNPGTPEDEVEVLQENHYYPFGMNHDGPWYEIVAPDNKYQYNGKELNTELELDWQDFENRWYDGSIGRFTGVDPIAEQFAWVSPYNYAENAKHPFYIITSSLE